MDEVSECNAKMTTQKKRLPGAQRIKSKRITEPREIITKLTMKFLRKILHLLPPQSKGGKIIRFPKKFVGK